MLGSILEALRCNLKSSLCSVCSLPLDVLSSFIEVEVHANLVS